MSVQDSFRNTFLWDRANNFHAFCSFDRLVRRASFNSVLVECVGFLRFQQTNSAAMLVTKACHGNLGLWLWWCRVELVSGHPRPSSVEALVYRGVLAGTHQCASDAQPGWHQGQSANPLYAVGASPVVLSSFANVCVIVVFCDMLEYLHDRYSSALPTQTHSLCNRKSFSKCVCLLPRIPFPLPPPLSSFDSFLCGRRGFRCDCCVHHSTSFMPAHRHLQLSNSCSRHHPCFRFVYFLVDTRYPIFPAVASSPLRHNPRVPRPDQPTTATSPGPCSCTRRWVHLLLFFFLIASQLFLWLSSPILSSESPVLWFANVCFVHFPSPSHHWCSNPLSFATSVCCQFDRHLGITVSLTNNPITKVSSPSSPGATPRKKRLA